MNWDAAGVWIGFGGLILSIIVAALAALKHVSAVKETLSERISTTKDALAVQIDAVEKTACAHADALGERESKARHDLANRMTQMIAEIKNDARLNNERIDTRLTRIETEMVRKPDLRDMEARIIAMFDKMERSVEKKWDSVCERLNKAEQARDG